jgi:hypothetical protein
MNMTPTCVCDEGYVAVGTIDNTSGVRSTRCEQPSDAVPRDFYEKRLPSLPTDLPGGREVVVAAVTPPVTPPSVPEPPPSAEFPMPRANPDLGGSSSPNPMASGGDGGCAMSHRAVAPGAATAAWLLAGLLGAASARRRRSGARS